MTYSVAYLHCFKFFGCVRDRNLDWKPFHATRSKESVDAFGFAEDESCVFGFCIYGVSHRRLRPAAEFSYQQSAHRDRG